MKVALIGDVHGNLPALEAVLAHARDHHVEALWNVGDFVGYGPFPEEVVQRLRAEQALSVVGNYDLKALQAGARKGGAKKSRVQEKGLAFRWAYEHLSKASRAYLRDLPKEIRLQIAARRILLVHGSPASVKEHLGPETPAERLQELALTADADVIICGHSHQPFKRKVAGVWFINPGSVGRPDDGDPSAGYAILQVTAKRLRVDFYRVPYDVARMVEAIRAHELPEAFVQMVVQGRPLEVVLGEDPGPPAPDSIMPEDPAAGWLPAVLDLARSCESDMQHVQQVTRLALQLFDDLKPLHGLGMQERAWLQYAGLLHDIGWIEGGTGHHKTALRIILETPLLPFDARERLIIGSIARYHRGALPAARHAHFAELKPLEQRLVGILAGLLRVADGLDCTHQSLVEEVTAQVVGKRIVIRCHARQLAAEELADATAKSDLLAQMLKRSVALQSAAK